MSNDYAVDKLIEKPSEMDNDEITFNWYQNEASKTNLGKNSPQELYYLCLGIGGETGEILEKVKKILRNKNGEFNEDDIESLSKEVGDVLWYLSQFCQMMGIEFGSTARKNILKLRDRASRNVIKSSGDER